MNIIDRLASFIRDDKDVSVRHLKALTDDVWLDKAILVKYLEALKTDGWNVQHEFSGNRVEVSINGDFTGFEYENEIVKAEQAISGWIQDFDNRTLVKQFEALEEAEKSRQKAWVVLATYDCEGDTILGVFSSQNLALNALELFKADETYSNHYHEFNIEDVVIDHVSAKTK